MLLVVFGREMLWCLDSVDALVLQSGRGGVARPEKVQASPDQRGSVRSVGSWLVCVGRKMFLMFGSR